MKDMNKDILGLTVIIMVMFSCSSCSKQQSGTYSEDGLQQFLTAYEMQMEALTTQRSQAEWNAYTTGKNEYFDEMTRLSLLIDSLYRNKDHFQYLKELRQKEVVKTPVLKRQLELVYKEYLARQIDPLLNKQETELATKLENTYANYRTDWEGKMYSDNQVGQILKSEINSGIRERIWRAQKKLSRLVVADLVEIAGLRNRIARDLGYENYFYMQMDLTEMDPLLVENVFEELYTLSTEPYRQVHDQIEEIFSQRYGISRDQLRPWHYEDLFAQEAPAIYQINLDQYYTKADIPGLAKDYFASFNVPVEDILNRSDLYERKGKNQHAFSFNIDRRQDIRILCNIVPDMRWMETMLHEMGHAVYDKYIDQSLPFLLREPAHSFSTEGIANLFGGFASDADWMVQALKIAPAEAEKIKTVTEASTRLSKLIFARWSMVVFNFEKAFYADPGLDLDNLWWNLVEKYQLIRRPGNPGGNEWATKIHIATYPVYYHNYQLGELFAAQLLNRIKEKYGVQNFWNQPEVGTYLRENLYAYGKKLPWPELIKQACGGEALTAKYFIRRYMASAGI
jgi:peptidyl-dipeptidase A